MVALAILVTIETVARKFFSLSLQGVDELGGYALAVTSSLAFTLALIDRAHIRIDLLHNLLPGFLQRLLNWLSITVLAAFALLLAWTGWLALEETIEFRSTAPTPWATPLVWPQSVWFLGLLLFAVASLVALLDATRLFFSGRNRELARRYGPKAVEEEMDEELADLRKR
ncbi:MAG: TRAP transporter small permease [Reyranella sp.]|nr:MAG: TRAP transporter small permease [Reyranella sp.]